MKILVVDDHVLIREALRGVIKELKGEATILEAVDWRQSMPQIEQGSEPDLILLVTIPAVARSRRVGNSCRTARDPSGHFCCGTFRPTGPRDRDQGTRLRRAGIHTEIGAA